MKKITQQNQIQLQSPYNKYESINYQQQANYKLDTRASIKYWGQLKQNQPQQYFIQKPSQSNKVIKTIYVNNQNHSQYQYAIQPKYPKFIFLLPRIFFSLLIKFHIIYFLVVSVLLFFQFQKNDIILLSVQLGLIAVYIILQLIIKFLTYKQLSKSYTNDNQYLILRDNQWTFVKDNQIKVGDLIKIKRNQRNPIKMLPLKVHSQRQQISIDTFDLDKKQKTKKIKIFGYFSKFFEEKKDIYLFSEKANFIVQYLEISSIGSYFKARIKFPNYNKQPKFDDKFTIPPNVKIDTQNYIIGLVLYNFQKQNQKNVIQLFNQPNIIENTLRSFIILNIVIDCFVVLISIVINIIFIAYLFNLYTFRTLQTRENLRKESYKNLIYLFINFLTLLSHSIHIIMYILLTFYRLFLSFKLKSKTDIQIRNYSKTVDQFGSIDTVLLDDYVFLKRQLLEVKHIDIKNDKYLDQNDLLQIITESNLFRQTFYNFWLALSNKRSKNSRKNFKINRSIKLRQKQIQIDISFEKYNFFLRFSQQQQSWQNEFDVLKLRQMVKDIRKSNRQGQLILVVKIGKNENEYKKKFSMIQQNDEVQQNLYHSMPYKNKNQQTFILAFIKFKYNKNVQTVNFINQIKINHNLIIMSSKSWELFQGLLTSQGIKTVSDHVIIIQQKNLTQFKEKLKNILQQLENNTVYYDRKLIIALQSQQVSFLSQNQIRNIFKKLGKYCQYFIFSNCQQFQKEICSVNITKIFPNCLFLTNFKFDQNICRLNHLNICLNSIGVNTFTTIKCQSYESILKLLCQQGIYAMRGVSFIIKSKIFKNSIFIYSLILVYFLVYRGKMRHIGLQYTQYIFFYYNSFFTIIPLLYYLIINPKWYMNLSQVQISLSKTSILYEYLKGVLMGLSLTFILYCFSVVQNVNNIFFMILINVTISANIYYLSIDGSISKILQFLIIVFQICFIIGLLIGVKFGSRFGYQFINITLNLDAGNIYMWIGCFLYCPIQSIILLFIFSMLKKEEKNKFDHKKRSLQYQNLVSQEKQQQKGQYRILKSNYRKGLGLRFKQGDQQQSQLQKNRYHKDLNSNYSSIIPRKKHYV